MARRPRRRAGRSSSGRRSRPAISSRAFIARVDWLLETIEPGESSPSAEHILTEGYAHGLRLERHLRRLEREMAELAAHAHEPQAARRLRRLAPRVRAKREELDELRNRLAALRDTFAGQSV